MKHIVLAVSYRAEMLEQEMKLEADKVRNYLIITNGIFKGLFTPREKVSNAIGNALKGIH